MADRTVVSVVSSDTATVTTYSDGSTDISYKNQPIVDPECANYTNADIDAGKVCQYNVGVAGKVDYIEFRYIPTERWTGKVQSWGELKANMDKAASLNPKFASSSRHQIYYNNPSWAQVISGPVTPDGKYRSPDYLTLSYHIENGEYDVIGYPDSFLPSYIGPTSTTANTKTYIVDPTTGIKYEIPANANGDTPITPDGRTLNQLVYPSGAPDPPAQGFPSSAPTSAGAPIAGPINQPAGSTTPLSGAPGTGSVATGGAPTPGGYVKPLVDPNLIVATGQGLNAAPPTPAPAQSGGMAFWVVAALVAAAVFLL